MNIFYISDDPQECAQALDDKRLNKMCTETAQIISTHFYKHKINGELYTGLLYKPFGLNHPCVKWIDEGGNNLGWILRLWWFLTEEYDNRFCKKHATKKLRFNDISTTDGSMFRTPPPKLVKDKTRGIDCSHIDDIHEAYKAYLNAKWATDKRPPKWTRRGKPEWCEV